MKATLFLMLSGWLLFTLSGCEKAEDGLQILPEKENPSPNEDTDINGIPEGSFVVTFSPNAGGTTRAAITGTDTRVRHLRYLIYKSTGEFVKEKVVLQTSDAIPAWPLAAMKDTLPKGSYTAVFLANVEKTMFPVPVSGGSTAYADVLTNYQATYANARIVLPNSEFTDTSEYYWANVSFSDTNPQPYVLLQRIISMLKLHRNFVDTQDALNKLTNNIVTQVGYKNLIRTSVQGVLPGLLTASMNLGTVGNAVYSVVGGLDAAVNLVAGTLVEPLTDALYTILLQQLVNQIGLALTGNANQSGALAGLGVLLNPWANDEANTAVVTIRNFPKTMDLGLTVKDYYTGDQRFRFTFTGLNSNYSEKDILIRGFNGIFDVRQINVIKQGLISGLLIDQIIDSSLLLNGTFIDINDPVQATVASNRRYKADYSLIDLGLKSYAQQTDGNHSLTLSIKLGDVPNINSLLAGIPILGPVLNATIQGLIGNITVSVPVNLPLLGVDNLTLSGGWSTVTTY